MRRLQIFFFVSMFIGGGFPLLVPLSASAEIRIIEGIPFEVDEIVEFKDGTVKVTIDDISKIINAKHVDDYISSFYFKNDKDLTLLQLKKYINNALSSSRLTRAALASCCAAATPTSAATRARSTSTSATMRAGRGGAARLTFLSPVKRGHLQN